MYEPTYNKQERFASSRDPKKINNLRWGELHKFTTEEGDSFWIKGSRENGKLVKHIQPLTDKEVQTHMWLKYDGIFTRVDQPPVYPLLSANEKVSAEA